MLVRSWLLIVALACSNIGANRQRPDAFEVASIKTRTGARVAAQKSSPDRFVRPDVTLRDLIRYAFEIQEFQIEGGPGWMASNRFEINARAATPSSPDGMRVLVRHLLEERFKLRTRTESRDMPMFELVTARRDGKLGEHLKPSSFDCEKVIASGTATADDLARCDVRFRPKMVEGGAGPPRIYSMTLLLRGVRLSRLATLLQNEVERTVVDKTGLDGTFDLELEFAPQGKRPVGLPGPLSPPSDGPPLATALQEQLGLRLESVRGLVPVVIVEDAELPTPD